LKQTTHELFERDIEDLSALLTEREVAAKLKISISGVRKLRWAGRGPKCLRWGRLIRYRARDVEDWLTSAYEQSEVREPQTVKTPGSR
jgi:hypothetical protein